MAKVLVVSPHPDDEAIGCGGTLIKHSTDGDEVHVIFLTSGEHGSNKGSPGVIAARREKEAERAAKILGVRKIDFWRQPDTRLRASQSLIRRMKAVIEQLDPRWIYLPHAHEAHPDHRAAFRLTRAAFFQSEINHSPPRLLAYEVWTPIQQLGLLVDITHHMPLKKKAIRAYRSQCAMVSFDAAAVGLSRYRGEMHCWPDSLYAEAFRVIKK